MREMTQLGDGLDGVRECDLIPGWGRDHVESIEKEEQAKAEP